MESTLKFLNDTEHCTVSHACNVCTCCHAFCQPQRNLLLNLKLAQVCHIETRWMVTEDKALLLACEMRRKQLFEHLDKSECTGMILCF